MKARRSRAVGPPGDGDDRLLTRRERIAAHRRRQIVEAAALVFHEKGYHATSIQDIADRVGILKGSLYHYIATKEDLLFEVIRQVQTEGLDLLEDAMREAPSAPHGLFRFVRAYSRFVLSNPYRATVFIREIGSLSEERRQALLQQRSQYDQFLRGLLEEGRAAGQFRADLDPVVTSNLIFQMVNSQYMWFSPEGRLTADEVADQIARLAINGVASPSLDWQVEDEATSTAAS